MRKIINTFKYGDKKVKRSLALAILAGVVTLAFGVFALVLSNMLCFFVAIVGAFVTISLIQTFMIAEGENPTEERTVNDDGANSLEPMEISQGHATNPNKSKKPKKAKLDNTSQNLVMAKKDEMHKNSNVSTKSTSYDALDEGTEDVIENSAKNTKKKKKIKKEKIKKEKTKKTVNVSEHSDEEPVEYQREVDMSTLLNQQATLNQQEQNNQNFSDTVEDDVAEENSKKKFKVISAETAATYTKKKIKKTLHKYKVMKDHRMVIVDRCDKLHIYQTPAYVWIQDNQFHILLIEEEPRLIMVPLFRITEISYLKKQPANEEKDYALFKKSTILTESFRPYLPDYNHSNKTTDLASYKNLYGITQGIYFTNNSAKNLFDILGVDFYVEDKVTTSNKVNIFFKEAYKANIKLRDNILDANGYAESITKILDDMAHSTISHNEFKDTLNLMIRNKLITEEYANHYMDVRKSLHG